MKFPFSLPFLSRKKKPAGSDPAMPVPETLDGPLPSAGEEQPGEAAVPGREMLSGRALRLVLFAAAGLVALAGAGAGGWWWRMTNRPEYAVEQLAQAFRDGDAAAFERRVDVDKVVDQLLAVQLRASVVQGAPPPDAHGTAQHRDALRQALLALPVGAPGEHRREDLLPPDFRVQMGAGVAAIAERAGDHALVVVPVKNEALEATFEMRVTLMDGKGGWRVSGLLDPEGQLAAHNAALERALAREHAAAVAEQNRIAERLAGLVRLEHTLVGIDTLSGARKFKALVVRVAGANQSDTVVGRVVVDCAVQDETGRVLRTLKLVRTGQLRPGEAFSESWLIDLDETEPKDVPLLNAKRLDGRARVRSVVLPDGEIIVAKGE